jgi:polar amino acid transport system substrate-binding protein
MRTFIFRLISILTVCLVLSPSAISQQNINQPRVPPEFLEQVRRLAGDTIRICISREGVLADFERDLAMAIGDTLLLEAQVVEVPSFRAPPILDYRFAANRTELFTILHNACEAMLGYLMAGDQFGDWATVTRPYLTMGFTFATTLPNVQGLGDLPAGSRIGTRMVSGGDLRFTDFNISRPEAQRWRRIPYPNNQLIIDRLLEGELDAILIWEAGLMAAFDGDPEAAGIRRIRPDPFVPPAQLFGAVLLSRDTFLRAALDEAFKALVESGFVDVLLAKHNLPGSGAR